MGRQSRVVKRRSCPSCGDYWTMHSKDFSEHVSLCRRATECGLELPGVGTLILPGYATVPTMKED